MEEFCKAIVEERRDGMEGMFQNSRTGGFLGDVRGEAGAVRPGPPGARSGYTASQTGSNQPLNDGVISQRRLVETRHLRQVEQTTWPNEQVCVGSGQESRECVSVLW